MADNPDAMDELRAILRDREATYSEAALTVDTTGHTPAEVAAIVAAELAARFAEQAGASSVGQPPTREA